MLSKSYQNSNSNLLFIIQADKIKNLFSSMFFKADFSKNMSIQRYAVTFKKAVEIIDHSKML